MMPYDFTQLSRKDAKEVAMLIIVPTLAGLVGGSALGLLFNSIHQGKVFNRLFDECVEEAGCEPALSRDDDKRVAYCQGDPSKSQLLSRDCRDQATESRNTQEASHMPAYESGPIIGAALGLGFGLFMAASYLKKKSTPAAQPLLGSSPVPAPVSSAHEDRTEQTGEQDPEDNRIVSRFRLGNAGCVIS